jgi:hypothetical protein
MVDGRDVVIYSASPDPGRGVVRLIDCHAVTRLGTSPRELP